MSRRNSRARQNRRIRGLSFTKRPKSRERSAEMERRAAKRKKRSETPLRHRGHDPHTRLRSADDGRTSLALILVLDYGASRSS
jgi:hypothetical protein